MKPTGTGPATTDALRRIAAAFSADWVELPSGLALDIRSVKYVQRMLPHVVRTISKDIKADDLMSNPWTILCVYNEPHWIVGVSQEDRDALLVLLSARKVKEETR